MAQPRKARAGVAFIYGIVGFSLIGLLAVGLRLKPGTPAGDAYEVKRADERRAHLAEIHKAADEKLLAAPSWVNKEKGIVRIPIADAIAIEAKALAIKEVKATGIKAEVTPTIVTPPYLTKKDEGGKKDGDKAAPEAAPEAAAPAATEGAAQPAAEAVQPATEEGTATQETAPAATPEAASTEEAAPAAPEASANSAN